MGKKKKSQPVSPLPPAPDSEQSQASASDGREYIVSARPPMPDGLVPADQLPSAVDVLAQLFPAEEVRKVENGSQSLPTSIFSDMDLSALSAGLSDAEPDFLSGHDEIASTRLTAPLSFDETSEVAETDPELHSLPRADSMPALTLGEQVTVSSQPRLENTTPTAEVAGSGTVTQDTKKRRRRGKASLRAIAVGIRRFLRASSRAKTKASRFDPAQQMGTHAPEPDKLAYQASLTEPSQPEPVEDSSANSSESLNKPVISASANPANANPVMQNLQPDLSGAGHLPLKETEQISSVGETRSYGEPESPKDSSESEFFRADASGGHHEAQPPEPAHSGSWDESADETDATDDDRAIATAIERYANLAAVAEMEANLSVSSVLPRAESRLALSPAERPHDAPLTAPLASPKQVDDQVDINAALDIPRDPEPAPTVLPSAGFFNPAIAGAEAFALSESTIPPAPSADVMPADPPLSNVLAHELPDATSASHLATIPYRDWSFEEKIGSHHEWIESKGVSGKRADLTAVDLEGSDLIGVDLRFVDLHDANLRAADLLMADLRDACLSRANLRDSCLVGANLEGANLEGASLETAMGLVPRQLAGANLHETTLPPSVQQFEALSEFKRTARQVHGFFVTLMTMSALSALLIWMTKDYQLLTNSAVLFFLHSATAAAALPTVQFYLIGPVALFAVYIVLQFHLQHLWDLAIELPAVFPDGHSLSENEPRIVLGLLRAHFRWMNADAPSTRFVEKGISMFLAYWIVPLTLFLFWARFLTLQELRGTVLQEILIVAATGVALYSSTKIGKPAERWMIQENFAERVAGSLRSINPLKPALILLGVLMFLSAGTMMGVPRTKERAPQFMSGSIRRWAPSVLWLFGIDPYADITEAVISRKPANWNGSDEQVASVGGAQLTGANFRYAQGYRAFLVNAHLLHANLQGAFLSQADLRSADLGQSNLKYAVLDQALMSHVNLDRATMTGANISRADLRSANLSYADMGGATLVDAHLDGATLYGSKLVQATLIRTNFERADLRESHLEAADLEHVDMQGAYLWSAKLMGARLTNAQLQRAILVDADLRNADIRWAQLAGTVLTGADLTGAYLDGADLRGAVGFGATQICSAKSRHGLLLDDAVQTQVSAECGAN